MNEANQVFINEQLSIPSSELTFTFSTAGGPGGQHVNKTETKVTLSFDVAHSPSLNEEVRQRLLQRLASRLDKAGTLHIQAQDSRSQLQNRETAVARLQQLLAEALKERKKRHPTRPDRLAQERRLAAKKRRSQLKEERGQKW